MCYSPVPRVLAILKISTMALGIHLQDRERDRGSGHAYRYRSKRGEFDRPKVSCPRSESSNCPDRSAKLKDPSQFLELSESFESIPGLPPTEEPLSESHLLAQAKRR